MAKKLNRSKPRQKKRKQGWDLKKFKTRFRRLRLQVYQTLGKGTLWGVVLVILLLLTYTLIQDRPPAQQPSQQGQADYVSKEAFVKQLAPVAQRLQGRYGVLASVSLAQAMLESDFGRSQLAARYYNLFGVKAEAGDPDGVDLETREFVNNEWITIVDRFKVYRSWEDSLTKHSELIYYGTSWNAQQYQSVLQADDYRAQARGLQTSGYATDPDYADKIIAMIEEWQLTQYD